MSRKKVWVASQPPSSVAGDRRVAPTARVWVRPQADLSVGPAAAAAAVSTPSSPPQRAAVGPGKACLAAVLASAAARPSTPVVGNPEQGLNNGFYLPSPLKRACEGGLYTQTAASAAQPSIAAGSTQAAGNQRPASKTWVRPGNAESLAQTAAPQLAQAAVTTAAADGRRLPAGSPPRKGASGSVSRQVGSRPPVSIKWTRPDSAPPSAAAKQTAPSPAAKPLHSTAGLAGRVPQPGPPPKKVWRRDDSPEVNGTAVSLGFSAAVGEASRSKADMQTSTVRSQPLLVAVEKRTAGSVQLSSNGSAASRQPTSRTWQNPAVSSAGQHLPEPSLAAAATGKTAAARSAPSASARTDTAGASGGAGRRLPVRPSVSSGQSPGARATALGRVANGRVSKPRSHKLQRIGEHLYRAQTGKSGRTLQRQGATPTASARLPRQGLRAVSRFAPVKAAAAANVHRGASAAHGVKRSTSVQRKAKPAEPTIFCPSFCRTGKCRRRAEGRCKYVHDDSKVAVCPGWLAGQCRDAACPLQHAHAPALMPVCSFFLQGLCSNTQCPYLHVNLDPAAPVCEAFLRGYCAAGAACRSKHLTKRMVRDLRTKRTLVAGAAAGGRAQKKAKVAQGSRPKRYFTEVGAMSSDGLGHEEHIAEHPEPDDAEDEDAVDTDPADLPVSPEPAEAAAGFTSPWPEFIHLPEDTDSE